MRWEEGSSERDDSSSPRCSDHSPSPHDMIPASVHALLRHVMFAVRESGSRVAVYLRGWQSLAPGGTPPCSPSCCILPAGANSRGSKSGPPPRLGLFPCLPPSVLPDASLEDRYVHFVLGISSFVAVGGAPVPFGCFRSPETAGHLSVISRVRQQFRDFLAGCGTLVPGETLGAGRAGSLLADALRAAGVEGGAAGPAMAGFPAGTGEKKRKGGSLRGSAGMCTGIRMGKDLAGTAVMPLISDRLAYPAAAADWDLSEYLSGDLKEAFDFPASIRVADPRRVPASGKVTGMGEFTKFAVRADAADGIELFADDELERDEDGTIFTAGFFALRKSEEKDRTVTSRIAQNARERAVGVCGHVLAHGVCLCEVVLEPEEKIRSSGTDLPDAYHHGRTSVERAKTNVVGASVPLSAFVNGPAYKRLLARRATAGLVPVVPARVRVAWRSLPMGDLNAVCFMTVAHINLIRRFGGAGELCRYRAPLPRGPLLQGFIVDDNCLACIVPRDMAASERAEDSVALDQAFAAYQSIGLLPQPKKTFVAQDDADYWGASIQGDIGRVRAHREVTIRTLTLVTALLRSRRATKRIWEAIIGLVVYVSLFARPSLAFLSRVFREADSFPDGEIFVPGRAALGELAIWAAFVPFMSTDLRAPVDTTVYATDASSRSCAAVETVLPEGLCREIWRHRPRRGVGQRYAGDGPPARRGTDCLGLPRNDEVAPPWAGMVCDAAGWSPVFHYAAKRSEHIAKKEARAVCTLVRKLASSPRPGGTRVISFSDSAPVVGAFSKGRSTSGRIGPLLRGIAPDLLLADLQIAVPWVPTAHNPADDPTRGRAVRRVPRPAAPVVAEMFAGVFSPASDELFEASLRAGAHLDDVLEPLGGLDPAGGGRRKGRRRKARGGGGICVPLLPFRSVPGS